MFVKKKINNLNNFNKKKKNYNQILVSLLNDLVLKTIHQQHGIQKQNRLFLNCIFFFSFDFLCFNPSFYNLKIFVNFVKLLLKSQKKILFLGLPLGIEKEFCDLVNSYNCVAYTATTLKHTLLEEKCVFSNLRMLKSKEIGLIFVLDFNLYTKYQNSIKRLNIPLSSFVIPNSNNVQIDYPLFFNVTSFKGSLFCYNLFFTIFKQILFKRKNHLRRLKNKKKIF